MTFRTEDGTEYTNYGVYREVVKDEKLVLVWHWRGEPEHESLVTVLLKPVEAARSSLWCTKDCPTKRPATAIVKAGTARWTIFKSW